jgi:hypothetical protein
MITQFCCRLLCGMSLCWGLMPRALVTAGFFRIQHLVALGLSVLTALTAPMLSEVMISSGPDFLSVRVLAVTAAGVAFVGSVLWTLGRRAGGHRAGVLIGLLTAAALLQIEPSVGRAVDPSAAGTSVDGDPAERRPVARERSGTAEAGQPSAVLSVLAGLSSAWLLGSVLTGMLLGHWYLTATAMPLAPLERLNQFLASAAVLRGIIAGVGLAGCPVPIVGGTHLVWLLLRWLSGIAGPLAASVLVWRILKYRNTQSATGVLFAGVILVFLGEMAATLLSNELHHPL